MYYDVYDNQVGNKNRAWGHIKEKLVDRKIRNNIRQFPVHRDLFIGNAGISVARICIYFDFARRIIFSLTYLESVASLAEPLKVPDVFL